MPSSAPAPSAGTADKRLDVNASSSNWIHLDFKGMMPSESRLQEWLKWIHEHGFTGVVMEYEDRLQWETFPHTYRPGFDGLAWKRIWATCADLGLQVTPLIQTYGHLEWLLKHEAGTSLRCGGHLNLLCPESVQAKAVLATWIQEVARLHPNSEFFHVGLDEVHHIGACPACQERAAQSPQGNFEILLHHARFVCDEVGKSGKRPIAWADMFAKCANLETLPDDLILCEWNYSGRAGEDLKRIPWEGGRELMTASAIRCSFPTYQMMGDLSSRVENVRSWHRVVDAEAGAIKTLLHTVWGRYRSLGPCYGPWEAWLPAFHVAGQPELPLSPVIREGMAFLKEGFSTPDYSQIEALAGQLQELHSEDPKEEAALRWWELSLCHYAEISAAQYFSLMGEAVKSACAYQGKDENLIAEIENGVEKILERIAILEKAVSRWLSEREWSECEEYLDSRFGSLRRSLSLSSTAGLVSPASDHRPPLDNKN